MMMKRSDYYIWKLSQSHFAKSFFKIRLSLSKIIFWWYYKRTPKHFHSWPFFQSVKILISNYVHRDQWATLSDKMLGTVIKENTKLHDKINAIELKKLIDESSVDFFNSSFGLNLPKASDN